LTVIGLHVKGSGSQTVRCGSPGGPRLPPRGAANYYNFSQFYLFHNFI